MEETHAHHCLAGTETLLEQFIPDHLFLYVTRGSITCFDGNKSYTLREGDYCMARKNRLAKYYGNRDSTFERILFCFDEVTLRAFQEKHRLNKRPFDHTDTFVAITPNPLIPGFIGSLKPYTDKAGRLSPAFEELKYEELLILLLQNQPELAGLLFNYAPPDKISLEEFMTRNYRFNVGIARFAYLTGRSLSAFKRDFKSAFQDTPGRWLVKRRLQEAYQLISREGKKASEVYLELGFEDLSHFSFAFKKQFGCRPTEMISRLRLPEKG